MQISKVSWHLHAVWQRFLKTHHELVRTIPDFLRKHAVSAKANADCNPGSGHHVRATGQVEKYHPMKSTEAELDQRHACMF